MGKGERDGRRVIIIVAGIGEVSDGDNGLTGSTWTTGTTGQGDYQQENKSSAGGLGEGPPYPPSVASTRGGV